MFTANMLSNCKSQGTTLDVHSICRTYLAAYSRSRAWVPDEGRLVTGLLDMCVGTARALERRITLPGRMEPIENASKVLRLLPLSFIQAHGWRLRGR